MTTPSWATMLRELFNSEVSSLYTALPAKVDEFFSDSNTIRATPLIPRAYSDDEGKRVVENIPSINRIPVVFPGSGGVRVKFPINVGDPVLLIFSHSALDNWLDTGRAVDPGDDRHHSLNDAIAIPGLQPFSGGNADPQIEFTTSGEIRAGGSSGLVTVAEFNSHVHATVTNLGTPTPPATPAIGTLVLKGG